MPRTSQGETLAFGVFEVDPQSGELRKHGLKIRLPGRGTQVLLALLEKPGQVVTRRELKQRLWHGDTFVEFDNGLNNAISRLRSALGDAPESPRFIETLPRHGYRFVAPVTRRPPAPARASMFESWPLRVTLIVVALAVAGFVLRSLANRTGRIGSLAVLPFASADSSGAAGQGYLGSAMTEAVLLDLSKIRAVRVVPLKTAARYARSTESPAQIAHDLHVDAIARGWVQPEGSTVRVKIRLVRGANGAPVWTGFFQAQASDFPALARDVTRGLVQAARLDLTEQEREDLAAQPQVNPQAYKDYLIGRYYMDQLTETSRTKALSYFEQAVAAAPDSAFGYAGLADYYEITDAVPPHVALPKAKFYALKALKINEVLASTHTTLAVAYFYGDWDWAHSEREFRRALQLNPGLERAHRMYARMLSCEGRTQEAIDQIHQAQGLGPLSIPAYDMAATVWLNAHQYDQSIQQANQLLELNPESVSGHEDLGTGYLFEGKFPEAIGEFEKAAADGGNERLIAMLLGSAYALWGKHGLAEQQFREMNRIAEQEYVPPFWFAVVYASLGDKQKALDWLDRAYREHDAYMVFLKASPWLDPLHREPRFQQLVRKMNFPG
jgi:DNA-binding winged helix-turn-helix (wHTH) protein/TolB-like protein